MSKNNGNKGAMKNNTTEKKPRVKAEDKEPPKPIIVEEQREGALPHPAYSIIPERRDIPIPGYDDTLKGSLAFLVEIEGENRSFLKMREAKKFVTKITREWRSEQGLTNATSASQFNAETMESILVKVVERLQSVVTKADSLKFTDRKKALRHIASAIDSLNNALPIMEAATGITVVDLLKKIEEHKEKLAESRKAKKNSNQDKE